MRQIALSILVVLFLVLLAVPVCAEDQAPSKPGGALVGAVSLTATIKEIDYKTRQVTLLKDDGSTVTMQVGEEARNFNQAQKGDKVQISYVEALAVDVQSDDGALVGGTVKSLERNPLGAKPGGVITETSTLRAVVEAIDHTQRTITLKGPEGNSVTLKVGESAKRFNEIKQGDRVAVVYTKALAISVNKP